MKLSPSWEATSCSATKEFPTILWNPESSLPYSQQPATGLRTSQHFMEPEGLLTYSQEPATGPCPDPN
jgi:hypothetical protein